MKERIDCMSRKKWVVSEIDKALACNIADAGNAADRGNDTIFVHGAIIAVFKNILNDPLDLSTGQILDHAAGKIAGQRFFKGLESNMNIIFIFCLGADIKIDVLILAIND